MGPSTAAISPVKVTGCLHLMKGTMHDGFMQSSRCDANAPQLLLCHAAASPLPSACHRVSDSRSVYDNTITCIIGVYLPQPSVCTCRKFDHHHAMWPYSRGACKNDWDAFGFVITAFRCASGKHLPCIWRLLAFLRLTPAHV